MHIDVIPATEALDRLREGNRRFAMDRSDHTGLSDRARRDELVYEQNPFAVVLGCSDSRVPAEFIFDQGLGDLFVIRVAGNVVAPSQVGSIEYAVEKFGVRLVLVLGHTNCGAVITTLEELERPSGSRSPNLRAIVDRIKPAVLDLVDGNTVDDRVTLLREAVRANVHASVRDLRHGSEIIARLVSDDELRIVGAEYSLESGLVEFFDDRADAE